MYSPRDRTLGRAGFPQVARCRSPAAAKSSDDTRTRPVQPGNANAAKTWRSETRVSGGHEGLDETMRHGGRRRQQLKAGKSRKKKKSPKRNRHLFRNTTRVVGVEASRSRPSLLHIRSEAFRQRTQELIRPFY